MKRALVVCVAVLMLVGVSGAQRRAAKSAPAVDAGPPAWQVELDKRRAALIAANGEGTDEALRARLLSMRDTDQNARGIGVGQSVGKNGLQIATNLTEVDANLTAQLKEIVAKGGWPTISLVGIDASNGAMTVLVHTRDHAWQVSLLPQLESLADEGKIDAAPLAVVIDKELVAEGKLQRYGTQFKYLDGGMAMYGVEDPGGLEEVRAKVGLVPEAIYTKQMEGMYHLKATGKIVSPNAPVVAPAP